MSASPSNLILDRNHVCQPYYATSPTLVQSIPRCGTTGPWRSFEESGVILQQDDFVSAVLKTLDTGRGLVDGDSAMKRVLDKAGQGLAVLGATENRRSFGPPGLPSCDAFAMTITGAAADITLLRAPTSSGSPNRAESSLDDIEEAPLDTNEVDADIEKISADGDFVTHKLAIREE